MTDEKRKHRENRYEIGEGDGKLLFGMLAGKMDLASREQIEDCLEAQKGFIARGVKKRIAQIFIDKGYISEDNAKKILAAQKQSLPKRAETPYDELVVLYGFATREGVAETMSAFAPSGRPPSELADFFIEKGTITKEQNRILAVAGRRIAGKSGPKTRLLMVRECPNCFETVPRSAKSCPSCKTPLDSRETDEDLNALTDSYSPGGNRDSCHVCHMTLPEGVIDCPYCGAEIDGEASRKRSGGKPPSSSDSGPILFLVIIVAAVLVISAVVLGIIACRSVGGGSTIGASDPNAVLSSWIGSATAAIESNSASSLAAIVDSGVLAGLDSGDAGAARNFLLNTSIPAGSQITISKERRFKMTAIDRAFIWIDYTLITPGGEREHRVKWRVRLEGKDNWVVTSVSEPST